MAMPAAPRPPTLARPDADHPVERLRRSLASVYERIASARARGRHAAASVGLVVVTKAAPPGAFDWMRAIGERDVGENRVQDAERKRESAPAGLVWHGIGHLQTNKVKKAVRTFDVFHALDSIRVAEALEPVLASAGRRWPVYLQVNTARDSSKGGVDPDASLAFAAEIAALPHLDVVGWMAMAKEEDIGEAARPCYRALREIRDEAVRRGIGRAPPAGLSMGMSDDYEVSVEEGATVVRVGRAIWRDVQASDAPVSPATPPSPPRTVDPSRTS